MKRDGKEGEKEVGKEWRVNRDKSKKVANIAPALPLPVLEESQSGEMMKVNREADQTQGGRELATDRQKRNLKYTEKIELEQTEWETTMEDRIWENFR
jgi:hypothetical protein